MPIAETFGIVSRHRRPARTVVREPSDEVRLARNGLTSGPLKAIERHGSSREQTFADLNVCRDLKWRDNRPRWSAGVPRRPRPTMPRDVGAHSGLLSINALRLDRSHLDTSQPALTQPRVGHEGHPSDGAWRPQAIVCLGSNCSSRRSLDLLLASCDDELTDPDRHGLTFHLVETLARSPAHPVGSLRLSARHCPES
jgi:hypothetical protein